MSHLLGVARLVCHQIVKPGTGCATSIFIIHKSGNSMPASKSSYFSSKSVSMPNCQKNSRREDTYKPSSLRGLPSFFFFFFFLRWWPLGYQSFYLKANVSKVAAHVSAGQVTAAFFLLGRFLLPLFLPPRNGGR